MAERTNRSISDSGEPAITRRRLVQAAGSAGIASLAGCLGDGQQATNGRNSGSSEQTGTVTLEVGSWGGEVEQKIVSALLREYDDTHKNVKVKYQNTPFGQYAQKLKTEFAGNTEPDVFYLIGGDAPSFMRKGALMNLTPYVTDDPNYKLDNIWQVLLNAFKYKGKIYGVPKDYTTLGQFYNDAIFKQAGVDSFPETWDEFRSALRTIKKETDVKYPTAFASQPRNTFIQLIWQNGGRVLNKEMTKCVVGSKEAIEALEYLISLYDEGLAALWGNEISATWGAPGLGKGVVATCAAGAWVISTLEEQYSKTYEDIRVANHIPIPKDGQKATGIFTTSWSASSSTKAPEKAAGLVKYLTSPEGMWKWARQGTALTARKPQQEKKFYDKHKLLGGLTQLTPWGHPIIFGPQTDTVLNTLMSEVEGAITGSKSAEAALKSTERQLNSTVF